ncbi:ribonuclease H-like domain-containing protein [Annulohypoxylon bovei var. microspora]|nr:ribonuclease H-like domain-containing protein [Annulohypoxylon bovei var. microspora]
MVYKMVFYVDGGCRRNGQPDAIGAAAACLLNRNRTYRRETRPLSTQEYYATNQRAELLAMIVALEWALEKSDELHTNPYLDVTIHSDSRYAVGCMSEWIYRWRRNGWKNARGLPVANCDLIREASDLNDRLSELGSVEFVHIPREQNVDADRACNEALDEQEDNLSSDNSSSGNPSSDYLNLELEGNQLVLDLCTMYTYLDIY